MALLTMELDPDAQAYADLAELDSTAASKLAGIDAGAEVNPADLAELDATANTKLTGIEEGAEANVGEEFSTAEQSKLTAVEEGATADQSGAEVRDVLAGLSDAERKFVMTSAISGQFKIVAVQRKADGKLEVTYDDTPVA